MHVAILFLQCDDVNIFIERYRKYFWKMYSFQLCGPPGFIRMQMCIMTIAAMPYQLYGEIDSELYRMYSWFMVNYMTSDSINIGTYYRLLTPNRSV